MSVRRIDQTTGEPVFGRKTSILPSGSEAVATLLIMRLKLMKDEWFINRTAGVGWLDQGSGEPRIFGKSADEQLLEAEVKRVTLETPGVASLLSYAQTFDRETRRASVMVSVSDVYGEVITKGLVIP